MPKSKKKIKNTKRPKKNNFTPAIFSIVAILAVGLILFISKSLFVPAPSSHLPQSTTAPQASGQSIIIGSNTTNIHASVTVINPINYSDYYGPTNTPNILISIALQEYTAPYCQGSAQAPVGSNGLTCAAQVNSTASTFTNTSGAFDCAGFVQYIYAQIGIHIPRTSQAQFGNFYTSYARTVPVPGGQNNTVPGDLVYFSIPGDHDPEPAHVAMCYVAGCNVIIQDGGPHSGMPGTIAPLNAVLCSAPNANPAKCIMGFIQVYGTPANVLNQTV